MRRPGGGRKWLTDHQPELLAKLEALIEPTVRGDPQSALRWTTLSVRKLEGALKKDGVTVSFRTVANLLKKLNYTLQGHFKRSEGKMDHPDRDAQFRYINDQAVAALRGRRPVISVDTKKKELVGHYKNAGREWRPKGDPIEVLTHDFPDPEVPKAVPYGIYDIGENKGWVNLGMSGDTAEFAVQSIREWWRYMGKPRYPKARRLLICADSGGSNGYRCHLWKRELQRFATEEKLTITICHFPPGTSSGLADIRSCGATECHGPRSARIKYRAPFGRTSRRLSDLWKNAAARARAGKPHARRLSGSAARAPHQRMRAH